MKQPDLSSAARFFNAVFPCVDTDDYCRRAVAAWRRLIEDDTGSTGGLRIAFLPFDQLAVRVVNANGTQSFDRIPGDSEESSLRRALLTSLDQAWFPVRVSKELVAAIELTSAEDAATNSGCCELIAAGLRQCLVQDAESRRRHMEAMAEFAAGAGHEINNPAATIVGRTQQLLRDESNPERRRILATIGAQAYRIRDMIGDAMLFARPPRPQKQSVDLGAAVSESINKVRGSLSIKTPIEVAHRFDGVTLNADPVQLQVVLCELLRNAVEASADGQSIRVTTTNRSPELAEIVVEDEGRGFTETERNHLFDPFFSGRQAGRGLGFGLPKAWRIVEQHNGLLTVETTESVTRFRVLWPTATASGGRELPEAV